MERLWRAADPPALRTGLSATLTPYLLGVVSVAAGAAVRLVFAPVLGDRAAFLAFVPALLIAAATGGLVPTLVIIAISLIAGQAILDRSTVPVGESVNIALFAVVGVFIGLGGNWLRRSRRNWAEAARLLRARQAHQQSILDTVPDAMIVIDERGVIESFSPAAERLFGWTGEEVYGRNVNILMPSPDHEAHDSYLERYFRTGEKQIIERPRVVTAVRRDGSTFPVELFVGETQIEGRTFFTGFLQDLTERQSAERHLQTLQAELIHLSRLSDMGEMTAILAHELNQPLSAISNYLRGGQRLLEAENPESQAIAPLARAAEQSLRAGEIIRRMRSFVSRDESERHPENLRSLVEEAAALALVGARERGVTTRFEFAPDVGEVVVDKIQIQQVLLNLVRNALDAMEHSETRELRVTMNLWEQDMAVVSVADTGSGISPEIADRLFQPFVTTKGRKGMGIGLSVCRTIVEAHGGTLWVAPNPGGGTIFRFTIPRSLDVGGK